MTARARITLVDIIYIAVSMAVLAFLAPVLYDLLAAKAGVLGTGELYLFQLIVPGILITMLMVIYSTAVSG
jgi:hypothetical protein